MNRQEKYPETATFHFYNANPRNRITGDCVFRAFTLGMNQDYRATVMEMAELMCETGYALNDRKGNERYLAAKGWTKHKQPRKADNTKYTGREFCKLLKRQKNHSTIIARIGGHHVVCIKDCKVWDIWDSTDGCIGNYWTKD